MNCSQYNDRSSLQAYEKDTGIKSVVQWSRPIVQPIIQNAFLLTEFYENIKHALVRKRSHTDHDPSLLVLTLVYNTLPTIDRIPQILRIKLRLLNSTFRLSKTEAGAKFHQLFNHFQTEAVSHLNLVSGLEMIGCSLLYPRTRTKQQQHQVLQSTILITYQIFFSPGKSL